MYIFRHIAMAVLLAAALAACSNGETADAPASKPDAPATAPAGETGQIPDMGSAELEAFARNSDGKATMVMIWATWCPSCKQQIPDLEKLAETHGDKVNILALSLDESKKALERFLEKKPIKLPVAWGDQQIARDHNVEAIPTLIIYDKTGQKVFGQAGVYPHSMLGAMVNKLASE